MQNREELKQKGHDGSRKAMCPERGKNILFRRGGGINIVFGPLNPTQAPQFTAAFSCSYREEGADGPYPDPQ
jgi:hypothetical protein